MKAKLVKRTGEEKNLSLVFSWGYFCFGPIYYLKYKHFLKALLLTVLYVFGIWKQCGAVLADLFVKWGVNSEYVQFLKIPGENYWITLGIVVGLHIVISFLAPKIIIKNSKNT